MLKRDRDRDRDRIVQLLLAFDSSEYEKEKWTKSLNANI